MTENALSAKRQLVLVRHTEFCCQAIPALLADPIPLVDWLDGFDRDWRGKLKPKHRGWLEEWEGDCREDWLEWRNQPTWRGNWLDPAYEIIEGYAPAGHSLYPLWGAWGYWLDASKPVATFSAIPRHAKRHPAVYGAVGGAAVMLTLIQTVYR